MKKVIKLSETQLRTLVQSQLNEVMPSRLSRRKAIKSDVESSVESFLFSRIVTTDDTRDAEGSYAIHELTDRLTDQIVSFLRDVDVIEWKLK